MKTLLPLTASAGILALALGTAAPRNAAACSCVRPLGGARAYYRDADAVLLAIPGAVKKVKMKKGGQKLRRPLRVVWTLKGKAKVGSTVLIDGTQGGCSATFNKGRLALVFLKRRVADVCAGNYALSVMLRDIPALLEATAAAKSLKLRVPGALLDVGLRTALSGYLHGRRSIPLSSKRLSPKRTIRLGKSLLRATHNRPKHGIILNAVLQVGPIAFISGSYPREGLLFSVLLQAPKSSSKEARGKVLYKSVAERKAHPSPTQRNRMP